MNNKFLKMRVVMNRFGNAYFDLIAKKAGGAIHEKKHKTSSHTALETFHKARRSCHPLVETMIGVAGLGVILWLLILKPF